MRHTGRGEQLQNPALPGSSQQLHLGESQHQRKLRRVGQPVAPAAVDAATVDITLRGAFLPSYLLPHCCPPDCFPSFKCRYYTWRKDTFSDLLLLLGVSLLLFLVAGWVEGTAMRGLDANLEAAMDSGDRPEWWVGIYAVRLCRVGAGMGASAGRSCT